MIFSNYKWNGVVKFTLKEPMLGIGQSECHVYMA